MTGGSDLNAFDESLGAELGIRAAAAPMRFRGARDDGVTVAGAVEDDRN